MDTKGGREVWDALGDWDQHIYIYILGSTTIYKIDKIDN